jgi:hypothetical protein
MTGADHVYWETKAYDFLYFLGYQLAERGKNIGVVFDTFLIEFGLVHKVVIHQFRGIVLAESIVTEKHIILCQVAEHAVRPVKHGRTHENKLLGAKIQPVPGLNHLEVPILMVIPLERLYRISRTIDGLVRNRLHQFRQSTAVVGFSMVGNDKIDVT